MNIKSQYQEVEPFINEKDFEGLEGLPEYTHPTPSNKESELKSKRRSQSPQPTAHVPLNTVAGQYFRDAQPLTAYSGDQKMKTKYTSMTAGSDSRLYLVDCQIPAIKELIKYSQWIVYNTVGGKDKVPVSAEGKPVSVTEPRNWMTFQKAQSAAISKKFAGLGFILADTGNYTCIDIDKCIDEETGLITTEAQSIIDRVNSYTEYSPSGSGIHIWIKGDDPKLARKRLILLGVRVEIYSSMRYITVTGNHFPGSPDEIVECTDLLIDLVDQNEAKPPHNQNISKTSAIIDNVGCATSDTLVIELLKRNSKQLALYQGDSTGYPSQSEAVHALIGAISRITRDSEQIDRIFRSSGMFSNKWKESKWDRLGDSTIKKILDNQNYELTDLGNSERFIRDYGDDLRYCAERNCWYVWDGTRWETTKTLHIHLATKTTKQMLEEANNCKDEKFREMLRSHARHSQQKRQIFAIVEIARCNPQILISAEDFDNPDRCKFLLNCPNGTLNLQTGLLQPHARENLITKLCPISYKPDALCPEWEKFLKITFDGSPEVIPFCQRTIGYTLTGSTAERCVFLYYGTGANGKSTYLESIRSVLGSEYAQRAPTALLMAKKYESSADTELARTKGVRFAFASETDEGAKMNISRVKDMTSVEKISARFLYENYTEFTPEAKIFLATNNKPDVSSYDQAIWDRIILIPFVNTVPADKRDRELIDKLRKEAEGILAWAVKGALEYLSNGLQKPQSVICATEEYRKEMDSVEDFIQSYCYLENLPTKTISDSQDPDEVLLPDDDDDPRPYSVRSSEIYTQYELFCKEEGYAPISQKRFAGALTDRGLKKERNNQGIIYKGLKLRKVTMSKTD